VTRTSYEAPHFVVFSSIPISNREHLSSVEKFGSLRVSYVCSELQCIEIRYYSAVLEIPGTQNVKSNTACS